MKKFLALLLTAVMALSVCTAAFAEGDVVTVALNPEYPPFEYVENDEVCGYDVDLINAIAEKAGFTVKFEPMQFASVITSVATNVNTIGVSGISITDERKLTVSFSEGYINAGLVVIAKADSGYTTTEDLKGKLLGVQEGTTSDFAAEEITGSDNVMRYGSFLNAVMDLQGNKLDAVVVDRPVGLNILASLNDASLTIIDMGLEADWYGIEVNKNNPELLAKIDAALAELKAEGFLDELELKYASAMGQ